MKTSVFEGDNTAWVTACREMARLSRKLPGGVARMDAFAAAVITSGGSTGYIDRQSKAVDDRIVICSAPGPKAAAFLEELRAAVAAKGVAA